MPIDRSVFWDHANKFWECQASGNSVLETEYEEAQNQYHIICPDRNPLVELAHRIERWFAAIRHRISYCLSGDDQDLKAYQKYKEPQLQSKAIKEEFQKIKNAFEVFKANHTAAPDLKPLEENSNAPKQENSNAPKEENCNPPKASSLNPTPATSVTEVDNEDLPPIQSFSAVGLGNASQNCWCNALFQMIVHTPPLRDTYLRVAQLLKAGPNPENPEPFETLADNYVAYSNAKKEAIAREEENATAYTSKVYQNLCSRIENLPKKIFKIPKDWKSSSKEVSSERAEKEARQKFKPILRRYIREGLETLPDQFKKAWGIAKATDRRATAESVMLQLFEKILREAWEKTLQSEEIPHLSQADINKWVTNLTLVFPTSDGKEHTVHRDLIADICHTQILAQKSPKDKKLLPLLASSREEAIQIGQKYGAALEEALEAYETGVRENKKFLPSEITQNIRLALHFLGGPNPDNLLNPTIHQSENQQVDASEAFQILTSSHFILSKKEPPELTFMLTENITYERTDDLLGDDIPEDPPIPVLPLRPEIQLPPLDHPQEDNEEPSAIKEFVDLELSVVNAQIRSLQEYHANLRRYNTEVTNRTKRCQELATKRAAALQEHDTLQEEIIQSLLPGKTPKYDVVDSDLITKERLPTPEYSLKLTLPKPTADNKEIKTPLMTLIDNFLAPPLEHGSAITYINEGRGYKYRATETNYQLDRFPGHLILALNRFSGFGEAAGGQGAKNNLLVDIPSELTLPEGTVKEDEEMQNPTYEFYGYIRHTGKDLEKGHYIAYMKDSSGVWIELNDSAVKPISEEEALDIASSAYMLFYREVV